MKKTIIVPECDFCHTLTKENESTELIMPAGLSSETSYAMGSFYGEEIPLAAFCKNVATVKKYDVCPKCLNKIVNSYQLLSGFLEAAIKNNEPFQIIRQGNREEQSLIFKIDRK